MSISLRQNFEALLAELPAFRKDLGTVVAAAIQQQPDLKDMLNQLVQGVDESIVDVKKTMPQAVADLEKGVAGLSESNEKLRQDIEEAERKLAETPPPPAPPPAPVPLPTGHGQTLRGELLDRFAEPRAAAGATPSAGDVQDLTSNEWKSGATDKLPSQGSAPTKPADKLTRKLSSEDVEDMSSKDW